jgi:hypothetical protein
MGFTKVWFVHNNTIWNSLLHITQRTSSQGKELHVVKHVVFCSSSKEMSIYNSSWDFCTTMFCSGLVSQREIRILSGVLTQFCVVPLTTFVDLLCSCHWYGISWAFCVQAPQVVHTGEGLWKFFWLSEFQCLQHSYFPPFSSSFIYHVSVKWWESNQGLTACVGALLNCT